MKTVWSRTIKVLDRKDDQKSVPLNEVFVVPATVGGWVTKVNRAGLEEPWCIAEHREVEDAIEEAYIWNLPVERVGKIPILKGYNIEHAVPPGTLYVYENFRAELGDRWEVRVHTKEEPRPRCKYIGHSKEDAIEWAAFLE